MVEFSNSGNDNLFKIYMRLDFYIKLELRKIKKEEERKRKRDRIVISRDIEMQNYEFNTSFVRPEKIYIIQF